jgi:hypothetical protein
VFAALLFAWPRGLEWLHSRSGEAPPAPDGGRTFARTRGGSFHMRDSKVKDKDTDFDQQDTDTTVEDSEFE